MLSNFWPLLEVGLPTQKGQGSFSSVVLCVESRVRAGRRSWPAWALRSEGSAAEAPVDAAPAPHALGAECKLSFTLLQ